MLFRSDLQHREVVPGPGQSLEQVVGEQPVPQLVGLDGLLALVAGSDDEAAAAAEALSR
mgnify:CR=1 FL=1